MTALQLRDVLHEVEPQTELDIDRAAHRTADRWLVGGALAARSSWVRSGSSAC